jgi:hypothetical protein
MAGTRRRGVRMFTRLNQIDLQIFRGVSNIIQSRNSHLAHPIQDRPDPGEKSGFLPLSGEGDKAKINSQ